MSLLDIIKSLFGGDNNLENYSSSLTRHDLIRNSRVLVVDDEKIELITELSREGFSVDHDPSGKETAKIEKGIYDLVLLDYAGVGGSYGSEQGLALLRHIRRINPAVFILAYTSKSLPPEHSDFYRLTDGTLRKDAGLQESIEKIESSLREALNLNRLWNAILQLGDIPPDSRKESELRAALIKSLKKREIQNIRKKLTEVLTSKLTDTLIDAILKKMFGLLI